MLDPSAEPRFLAFAGADSDGCVPVARPSLLPGPGLPPHVGPRHRLGLGFFALPGLPLSGALLTLAEGRPLMAPFRLLAFVLSLSCFVLFILSDKARFRRTIIAREGLWARFCLAAMYLPFLADAGFYPRS